MQKVMHKIIHTDQLGFLKDRYIGEGVRKLEDLLEHGTSAELEGYILQLDFRKAFDSIEWHFLFDTLNEFGFGENITKWIKLCYTNIESCVLNNGFTTSWFSLLKGLRQGCPLSAYLFLLCVEVLAQKIRRNPNIVGLKSGDHEQKLSLFADDCTCILKNVPSVRLLLRETEQFSHFSGLTLNEDKCEIYSLQAKNHSKLVNMPFKLQTHNFKVLGITLGRDTTTKTEANITSKFVTISKSLNRWSQRNLSLIGKILVTKTHAVAKMVHAMTIMPVTSTQRKELQKILTKFIWSGKPPKVKHNVIITPYDEGGLQALDIECQYKALRLPWIWRLLRSTNWCSTINSRLAQVGGTSLLIQCNYDINTISFLPLFYREIFTYWQEIVGHLGLDELIVWNNKEIKIANKTIFINNLYQNNVVFIHDFFKNGELIQYDRFCEIYKVNLTRRSYSNITRAIMRYITRNQLIFDMIHQPRPQYHKNKTYFRLTTGKHIDLKTAKCKHFYKEFLVFKGGFPSALTYWHQEQGLNEDIFYNSLPRSLQATKETKIIAFQFKTIHNIINNNANLHKWKIKESSLCAFCNQNKTDDIVHEFTACTWTRSTIAKIARELGVLDKFRQITNTEFIFGILDPCLNNILLIIKHTLHVIRSTGATFNMNVLKAEIYKRIISDERSLSISKFRKKWLEYSFLVDEAHVYFSEIFA